MTEARKSGPWYATPLDDAAAAAWARQLDALAEPDRLRVLSGVAARSDGTANAASLAAELRLEPTDPDEIVQECLALVQDKIEERKIEVVCTLDGNLGLLPLDAREIHKALMNVLVNALDYRVLTRKKLPCALVARSDSR